MTHARTATIFWGGLLAATAAATAAVAAEKTTFEEHVRPIFRQHCAACHNLDDAASDFAADDFGRVIAGGASGEVVAAGDAEGSRLWRLITHAEEPVMPPGGEKLPAEQLAAIRKWIEGGLLKDAGSKALPTRKPAIAAVDPAQLGKPVGEPAMPIDVFRQPVVTAAAPGPIDALATSPWAPLIAVGWQRQVSLYHAETHALLGVVPYLEGRPRVVRFSADGSLLLIAGGREGSLGNAAVYDVKRGVRLATVGDELDAVLAADISPDNALVAIGGSSKKVRVFRVADGSLAYTLGKHTDWVTSVAFSPDGALLATADRAAGLRLWQAAAGYERGDLRGHNGAITRVAWRPDGGVLASASEDGTVRLWKPSGEAIKTINVNPSGVLSAAFLADGRIVTVGRERFVKRWNAGGAHEADLHRFEDVALAAEPTHDGLRVVASDWSGAVTSLPLTERDPVARLAPNPPTLETRLAAAAAEVARQRSNNEAALTARDRADAKLRDTRARKTELGRQFAAAARAADAAAEALLAAETRLATRRKTLASAEAALGAVEAFAAGFGKAESNEPASSESASEAAAAKTAREALVGAVESAKDRLEVTAVSAAQAKSAADSATRQLAKLKERRASLPDLAELESALQAAEKALATSNQALETAVNDHARLGEEIKAFAKARQRMETAAAAAEKKLQASQEASAKARARRDAAAGAKDAIDAAAEALAAEVADLKRQLAAKRAESGKAQAAVDAARSRVEDDAAREAAADRALRVERARLEQWTATQRFRDERKNAAE